MNLDKLGKDLIGRLKNPLQLRFILAAALLASWYFLVYPSFSGGIEESERARVKSEAHRDLARQIVALRGEVAKFKPRLPVGTDPNEWVEYLLGGVRRFPLRMMKLEPLEAKRQGPYEIMVLRIELQGRFSDLEGLMAWVESNPRLFRIDSVGIDPTLDAKSMVMRLTILGLMG